MSNHSCVAMETVAVVVTKRGGFRLRARQASSEQNGHRKHDFVQLRHDGEEKKLLVILQHEKHRRARVGTSPKKLEKCIRFLPPLPRDAIVSESTLGSRGEREGVLKREVVPFNGAPRRRAPSFTYVFLTAPHIASGLSHKTLTDSLDQHCKD